MSKKLGCPILAKMREIFPIQKSPLTLPSAHVHDHEKETSRNLTHIHFSPPPHFLFSVSAAAICKQNVVREEGSRDPDLIRKNDRGG